MGIDSAIDEFFEPISNSVNSIIFYSVDIMPGPEVVEVKLLLIWLAAAAVFFSFYLGFINLRYFGHAIALVRGKEFKSHKGGKKKKSEGQISRFQALATSLSGTVGLGNIAGVAIAVSVGGPGAVFWMIVMGFLSMSTKFAEVMMGVKYRIHGDPTNKKRISGGPMYYLKAAFENRGLPHAGTAVAAIFAFACICGSIGGGNMFQANQSYQQLLNVTGGDAGWLADKGWAFGLFLSFVVGVVIIGGIKSIANVASRLVPVMGAIYIVTGLIVIAANYHNIPHAFHEIFVGAFSMEAGLGGFLGGMLIGVQRAVFSNEAGLGSAPIVHSAAQTNNPVSQGFVGMLGPFVDTIIICLVTALVIVISGAYETSNGISGVSLTSQAMESGASWFPYILALTVLLFAYSTLITWSYYGMKALTFLGGEHKGLEIGYKLFFCLCVIIGSSVELKNLIGFTDAMILGMAIPNILGLYLLAPEIKKDLKKYIAEYRP